jgi:hypothetical protein
MRVEKRTLHLPFKGGMIGGGWMEGSLTKKRVLLLFFVFEEVVDLPRQIIRQTPQTGGLGGGQLFILDLFFDDPLDTLADLVKEDVVDHGFFIQMITTCLPYVKIEADREKMLSYQA